MSHPGLERIKAAMEDGTYEPVASPMFREKVLPPEPTRPSLRSASGHKGKEGKCHCGYDQTCPGLYCGTCGRRANHNIIMDAVVDKEATQAWKGEPWKKFYEFFGYKRCSCGAKDWLYTCEARNVRRAN